MGVRTKLPVWATVIRACRSLAMSWKSLFAVLMPSLALLFSLDFALAGFWSSHPREPDSVFPAEPVVLLLNLDLIMLLVVGALAVALWQRRMVLGRDSITVAAITADWQDLAALVLYWAALIIIFTGSKLVASMPMGLWAVDMAGKLLGPLAGLGSHPWLYSALLKLTVDSIPLLVALHIAGRLGLAVWALPGAPPGALERAWIAGRGNGWRIAFALYLLIVPLALLESMVQVVPDQADFRLRFLLWMDVFGLLQLALTTAGIAAAHGLLAAPEGFER